MDLLNNLNVVISIIVGIFGIGGYIVGIVAYLRGKATSSQQKQTTQPNHLQKQSSYQTMPKLLSKLDWMEILWKGFEDYLEAFTSNGGVGCIASFTTIFIGAFITAILSTILYNSIAFYIIIPIMCIIFITVHILFYVYFVGRRVESKTDSINQIIR